MSSLASEGPPIAHTPVAKAYSALRNSIVDGQLRPGARMNIQEAARQLAVSQTPVREAFQRLHRDGLLTYHHGRGYRTTPVLDLAGLRSVFEFRLLVEPWACRSAAADRLSNPAVRLLAELHSFEETARSGTDLSQQLLGHDTRFHDLILGATGNPVVHRAYEQTHCHLHLFRLYPADVGGKITIEEHRRICQAIHDCDPDAAETAMKTHIKNSYLRSVKAFDEPAPPIDSVDRMTAKRGQMLA